jgi:hypothetical protein
MGLVMTDLAVLDVAARLNDFKPIHSSDLFDEFVKARPRRPSVT